MAGQQNKIVVIIQTRMKSTRLPGKILMPMPITGEDSILECIINQLKESQFEVDIFIATSVNPENDELEIIAKKNSVKIFRGSENDVLSRFINILESKDYDTAVRVTADNPILDYKILDNAIEEHLSSKTDYSITKGLPLGMNFELFKSRSLLKLKKLKLTTQDKEHVTLKLRQDNSFKINEIKFVCFENESLRLTVDYPEDYLVISTIYQIALHHKLNVGLDLIKFIEKEYPWLLKINAKKTQKKVYNDLDEELKDVIPILSDLNFKKTASLLKKGNLK
ncbi:cytidylyltransferase domain-containing protein [Flavobacterium sp. CS20]|uniref:cytidylyltransferase domain-containing protein n=1 Tax=Flavobacterium sp. CS20 TaxID=2775246 RepID=UPI001B3A66AE|nr:hypothetical protein [Flavobacterium sp. CS20]QTY26396.1 hypothetical protein IGB25_10655 [Flavobacterium sp. CS20]